MHIQFYILEIETPSGPMTALFHSGFGGTNHLDDAKRITQIIEEQFGDTVQFTFIKDEGNEIAREKYPAQYQMLLNLAMKNLAKHN